MNVTHKRFVCPPGMSCGEFVMRELTAVDDYDIAAWTEQKLGGKVAEDADDTKRAATEQIEMIRRALVEVDGVPVNLNGVPYAGMDEWSRRTMMLAARCFRELNALSEDEVKACLSGAKVVTPGQSRQTAGADADE